MKRGFRLLAVFSSMLFMAIAGAQDSSLDRLVGKLLPHRLDLEDQLDMPGVQLFVGYLDDNELEDAVPGDQFKFDAYLVSEHPIVATLTRALNDSRNTPAAFRDTLDFQPLRKNELTADRRFFVSGYRVTVIVNRQIEPKRYLVRLDFGGKEASVCVPVGMAMPQKPDDPNYVILHAPQQVEVNAFGEPDSLVLTVDNKFPEYVVRILGYQIRNSQNLIVNQSIASKGSDKPIAEVRRSRPTRIVVPLNANAWRALWVPDSNPQMNVTVLYTDGWRVNTQIYPDLNLPFRLTYSPTLTLILALIGSLIGALFRGQAAVFSRTAKAEKMWPITHKLGVWAGRLFLALLAGFVGWVLSYSAGVELTAKSIALVSAKTPDGALLIGAMMGLIPPSSFGDWLYRRLTGSATPAPGGTPVPANAGGDK